MKNKNKKHLLTVALASLIIVSSISASVMSGCGCDNSVATPDSAVKTTEVVTQIVENTYFVDDEGNKIIIDDDGKEFIVDDSGNVIAEVTENQQSEVHENDASSSDSSQTSNNQTSEKSEPSESSKKPQSSQSSQSSKPASSSSNSNNNSSNNNSGVLSIDGNKFKVGDIVTCTYKFSAPEVLENYQGEIKYDNQYLTVKGAKLVSPASSGGILNYKLRGEIKFNGSNISGAYDYTNGGDFIIVTYEVTGSGSTTVSESWVAVTGESQKSYVSGDKLTNGAKMTKTYSK